MPTPVRPASGPPVCVHLVAAARPNFMKIAPLWRAFAAAGDFRPVLVHSGQHYDANMSDSFFEDLGLPEPDHHLGIGSGSHAEQTGGVMIAYEQVAATERPDWTIVAGDVNTTAACAITAAKLGIRLVHLEAGLRSFDRTMPEEINRLVTDAVADVLWTPSPDADENLLREGVDPDRISNVGNIMIDSFEMLRATIESERAWQRLGLDPGRYGVVTLHRPSNVDDDDQLGRVVAALSEVQASLPLVFPVHPRTRARLAASGLDAALAAAGMRLVDPLSYIPFMSLVVSAAAVITDSGGIQEETSYLGIPCLTLRRNTERPITVTHGTNRLVAPEELRAALAAALERAGRPRAALPLWDGRTAERCLADLRRRSAASERMESVAAE